MEELVLRSLQRLGLPDEACANTLLFFFRAHGTIRRVLRGGPLFIPDEIKQRIARQVKKEREQEQKTMELNGRASLWAISDFQKKHGGWPFDIAVKPKVNLDATDDRWDALLCWDMFISKNKRPPHSSEEMVAFDAFTKAERSATWEDLGY